MTTDVSSIGRHGAAFRALAAVLAANLLLILSAKIQVPFWPVPMTMQSLVVVALGLGLGARLGATAMLLYLLEGALGLPVFAGTPERGLGVAYMVGPTGGYLVGFLICTVVVGLLAERRMAASLVGVAFLVLAGHAIILACGAAWLGVLSGSEAAWSAGVVPFLAGTLVKSALGVLAGNPLARLRTSIARS